MRVSIKSRRRFGQKPGTTTTKEILSTQRNANLDSRTLYAYNLCKIPKTTVNDNNSRIGQRVNIRGFRVYWRCSCLTTVTPLVLSYAIVQDRENSAIEQLAVTGFTGSDTAAANDTWARRFFGDRSEERDGINFAVERDSLVFNRYPINKNKYNILIHKKVVLNPQEQDASNAFTGSHHYRTKGQSYFIKKFYVPIKRQLHYHSADNTDSNQKLFLVFWIDYPTNTTGVNAAADVCATNLYVHTVFRDTR